MAPRGALARPVVVIFVLAVLARHAGQVVLGAFVHPETWEYEAIASNVLAGRGYTYVSQGATYVASVSSPLYVFLIVFVYLLTGHSHAAMLVVQAILGGATAALIAWLAGRTFSPRAAWIAGTLAAVHPGLVVYAAKLHALSLDMLAFTSLVCATVALPMAPGARWLGLVGALFGLAALTRGTVLSLLPVTLVWLSRWRGVRLASRSSAALLGGALLVCAPWSIHNSVLLGQPVLGSSEATEWLWRGTNPAATGSSWTVDGRLMLDAAPAEFRARVLAANEAERIGIYRDAALRFIQEHPARAMTLYLAKLKAFWWGSASTGILYPSQWVPWYFAWYAATLACAASGCWWALRHREARAVVLLILLVLLAVSATQSVFYVEGRHRLAIEPLLLVLAGGGLSRLVSVLNVPPAPGSRSTAGARRAGRSGLGSPGPCWQGAFDSARRPSTSPWPPPGRPGPRSEPESRPHCGG
jgi:4-amino-4-deoxy-L-arabinose transferase-like glycosyltransferase